MASVGSGNDDPGKPWDVTGIGTGRDIGNKTGLRHSEWEPTGLELIHLQILEWDVGMSR